MASSATERVDEMLDQLDNLEGMCGLFARGQYTIYKNIAVTLRFLLTGSSGDQGLFPATVPSAQLPPVLVSPVGVSHGFLALPARVRIVSGKADLKIGAGVHVRDLEVAGGAVRATVIGDVFGEGPALPVRAWLDQPFLRQDWKLGEFIAIVANKDGGAHLARNAKLAALKRWGYFHWHVTAGIARGVLPTIRGQLMASYPHHARAVR
jgi:hypothetical protein